MCALDEAVRQPQFCAKALFMACHRAVVGLVIVSGQMQQTVKHQHLDLSREGVALPRSLPARSWDADGKIAGDPLRGLCVLERLCGKRKNIRRLVLAAKLAIQPSDLVVGGKQDRDLAAQLHGGLRLTQKAGERARGRNSVVPGMSRWVGAR